MRKKKALNKIRKVGPIKGRLSLAKENSVSLKEEEAKAVYAHYHSPKKLSPEELNGLAGGYNENDNEGIKVGPIVDKPPKNIM